MLQSFCRRSYQTTSFLSATHYQAKSIRAISTCVSSRRRQGVVVTVTVSDNTRGSAKRYLCSTPEPKHSNDTVTEDSKKEADPTETTVASEEGGDARTDLQIHLDYIRLGKTNVLAAKERSEQAEEAEQFFQLQHPLLDKYGLDMADFCEDATEALNSVLEGCDSDELQLAPPSSRGSAAGLSFAGAAFSEQAFAVLQDVAMGRAGMDDVQSRMQKDLQWFSKFGLSMEHVCAVRREVTFGYVRDVRLYVCSSPNPTEETIWGNRRGDAQNKEDGDSDGDDRRVSTVSGGESGGELTQEAKVCAEEEEQQIKELQQKQQQEQEQEGEQRKHVHAVVNAVFQLHSDASIKYFVAGPPRYDLSEFKDDSVSLLHVRFIGCISSGDELEWRVSRLAVVQLWPPSLWSMVKGLFS